MDRRISSIRELGYEFSYYMRKLDWVVAIALALVVLVVPEFATLWER